MQHLGLLSFFLLFGGTALLIRKWPLGKHLTVSQHVAANKHLAWCFISLSILFLFLFLTFLVYWFIPTFQVSAWFGACIVAASITQFASALILEVGGWKTRWHRFLAGVTGALLIPALSVLIATDTVSITGKVVTFVGILVMITIATVLAKDGGKHNHFLILQFCYFGAFFVSILFVTYT